MSEPLAAVRRRFAEQIGAAAHLPAPLVDAFASVPRERFLDPGPWLIRRGNGAGPFGDGAFDAILVNAGVTHPLTAWLDALAPGGRMVLPLTGTMPMPMKAASIGKGMQVLLTRGEDGDYAARTLSFVAIYSALELRDHALEAQLTASMLRGRPFTRLARGAHTRSDECFLHADEWCLRRS